MTEKSALAAVEEGLVSERSLSVQLRMGKGFDTALFERTKTALQFLAELYRERDVVPKSLAFAFVDLGGTLMAGDYPEDLWYQVRAATDELVAIAYSIFEPA